MLRRIHLPVASAGARKYTAYSKMRLSGAAGENIGCSGNSPQARNRSTPIRRFALKNAANKYAIGARRAPVHSSSHGALLRLCEVICDFCKFWRHDNDRLAFAARYPSTILELPAMAFPLGIKLSRHRYPAYQGLSHCSDGVMASPLQWNR